MLVAVCSPPDGQPEDDEECWSKSKDPTEKHDKNYSKDHRECLQVYPLDFSMEGNVDDKLGNCATFHEGSLLKITTKVLSDYFREDPEDLTSKEPQQRAEIGPANSKQEYCEDYSDTPQGSPPECDQDRFQNEPPDIRGSYQEGALDGDGLDSFPESHHGSPPREPLETEGLPSPREVGGGGLSPGQGAQGTNSLCASGAGNGASSPGKSAAAEDSSSPVSPEDAEDARPQSPCETVEASHASEAPYRCGECGVVFPLADALLAHLWAHIEAAASPARRAALRLREPRPVAEPLRCALCPKAFRYEKSLQAHVLRVHVKQEVLACTVCRAEFTSPGALRMHVWKHVTDNSEEDAAAKELKPKRIKLEPLSPTPPPPPAGLDKENLSPKAMKVEAKFADQITLGLKEDPLDDRAKSLIAGSPKLRMAPMFAPKAVGAVRVGTAGVGSPKASFRCSSCPRTFPKRIQLSNHARTHVGGHRNSAGKSGQSLVGPKAAAVPAAVARPPQGAGATGKASTASFTCDICPRDYKTRTGLYYHMKVHRRDDEYFCHLCQRPYDSKLDLTYHLSTAHPWDFVRTGRVPGHGTAPAKPPPLLAVLAQAVVATPATPYRCPECPRAFPKKRSLSRHYSMAHARKATAAKSPAAPAEESKGLAALARSPGRSSGRSPGAAGVARVACRICKNKFDTMRGLHIHMVRIHKLKLLETMKAPSLRRKKRAGGWTFEKTLENRPYACTQCHWRFKSQSHLVDHMESVHSDGHFTCDKCLKTFRTSRFLRRHQADGHAAASAP